MITIQREFVETLKKDGKHLFEKDWEETVVYAAEDFNINVEYYQQLEAANRLLVVTARDCGVLIGYVGFIQSVSVHNQKSVANCCGIFVEKKYRGGKVFLKMFLLAKEILSKCEIHHIRVSASPLNDSAKLFEHLGMKKEETIYGMQI